MSVIHVKITCGCKRDDCGNTLWEEMLTIRSQEGLLDEQPSPSPLLLVEV